MTTRDFQIETIAGDDPFTDSDQGVRYPRIVIRIRQTLLEYSAYTPHNMRSLLHSLIFLVTQTLATRHIVIVNQCPSAINLYTSGVLQQSLPANGGQTTRDVADTFSDFFYTDVNGGNANGVGTTRAGFYGPVSSLALDSGNAIYSLLQIGNYYAVVDPNYFNIGVSIRPNNVTSVCSASYVTIPEALLMCVHHSE